MISFYINCVTQVAYGLQPDIISTLGFALHAITIGNFKFTGWSSGLVIFNVNDF